MTAYPDIRIGQPGGGLAAATGPGILLVSIVSAVGVFWFGLGSLQEAWSTPEYSHGPVIPVLSAYMFLVEMRRVPPAPGLPRDSLPGLWVVGAALLLGALGSGIPEIVSYALILWIWGMVLTVFGFRRGWMLWPPVLHLVFMLPLPQIIQWNLTPWLQRISSEIGVAVIAFFGVPVFLDGNVIDLGVYKLQVAEACSGLRYLFPIMSFSYVFGVLYTGPRWHKIVLFLAAAPVAVLMNSFRIGMIGVLVDRFGIEQAEGFLHAFEGWIIFIACILILFALAAALQRTRKHPQRIADTLDLDLGGVLPQARRFLDIRPTRPLLIAAIATVSMAVAMHATPAREQVLPERLPLALFPSELGGWQAGQPQRLDPTIAGVLAADDYLSVNFTNPADTAPVDFFVAYYDRQPRGSSIHSPQVCIPGGGWEVSDWQQVSIPVETSAGAESVTASRAVIQKGLSRQLVLYWSEQRGRRIANVYAAWAVTLWDALAKGRTDAALVRLVTPISAGETPADAERRLVRFLGESLEALPRFVPG